MTDTTTIIRLCRERAAQYGAVRGSSPTAIALDRAADALGAALVARPQPARAGVASADTEGASQPREEAIDDLLRRLRDWAPGLTAVRKDCLDAADVIAALTQRPPEQAGAVPAGDDDVVMIPREPTEAMMNAGLYHSSHDSEWVDVNAMWKAMFDAVTLDGGASVSAPAAPTPPDAGQGEIPAGMKPWRGGDSAPADWDGGPALHCDQGFVDLPQPGEWQLGRIIAYTPKAPPQTPPDAGIGSDEVCEQPYLVWSNEHRAWWKPEERGYTRKVSRAGRYSREVAFKIAATRGGGWPVDGNPYEIAIPERDAVEQASA
jgi:hypothetical protein